MISLVKEPRSYQQAITADDADEWKAAIQTEYDALISNKTWELVPLPRGRRAIRCMWLFKVKMAVDRTIDKYKARLVAGGDSQKEGIDFHETWAPVVKMTSVRVLLSIAAMYDLELHQMDVKTAFLNGDLEEEIYMRQPEGYTVSGSEHLVCRLRKTLYGLKQSPREWYKKINKFFAKHGFKRIEYDYGLYIIWNDNMKFIIALYVDDLLLACNRKDQLNVMKQLLSAEYEMKDLGEAKFVLGIEIERDRQRRTVHLNQSKYVEEVLERFDMSDCKGCPTPMDAGLKLSKPSASEVTCSPAFAYQSAVGSLMYAMTSTRPDLAFAVSAVSRYCSNYTATHWQAVKRILRYLQFTKHYRLQLVGTTWHCYLSLSAYSDADWGNDLDEQEVNVWVRIPTEATA